MTNPREHVFWACQDRLIWGMARKCKTVLRRLKTTNVVKDWCEYQSQSILSNGQELEGWLQRLLKHWVFWVWIPVLMVRSILGRYKGRKLKSRVKLGKYVWSCDSRNQHMRTCLFWFVWWWCLKWGNRRWRRIHLHLWIRQSWIWEKHGILLQSRLLWYEDRQYKDDMKLTNLPIEVFFIIEWFNLLRWLRFMYFRFLLFNYLDRFEFMRPSSTNSYVLCNKIQKFSNQFDKFIIYYKSHINSLV